MKFVTQDINSNVIPYSSSQPVEPNLWDGKALLISIFSTNKFTSINTSNISIFFLKITN